MFILIAIAIGIFILIAHRNHGQSRIEENIPSNELRT